MCGALASALRKGLDDFSVVECDEPPLADLERWNSLTATSYSDHVGTDYAR